MAAPGSSWVNWPGTMRAPFAEINVDSLDRWKRRGANLRARQVPGYRFTAAATPGLSGWQPFGFNIKAWLPSWAVRLQVAYVVFYSEEASDDLPHPPHFVRHANFRIRYGTRYSNTTSVPSDGGGRIAQSVLLSPSEVGVESTFDVEHSGIGVDGTAAVENRVSPGSYYSNPGRLYYDLATEGV